MQINGLQAYVPSRGGEARVEALPQRGVFNVASPEAPRVGPDLTALDLAPPEDMDAGAIKKAASDFEAHFLSEMFRVMRSTVPESGLFGEGFSQEVYTEMLDKEYARLMTDHGGIGLAAMLARQLSAPSEGSSK
jgi:hypothetical protein